MSEFKLAWEKALEILERKGGWELIGNASQRAVVATVIDGKIYYVSCDVGAATRTGLELVLMGSELRFKNRDGSIGQQVHLTWEGFRTEMEDNRRFLFAMVHTQNGLLPILDMYARCAVSQRVYPWV